MTSPSNLLWYNMTKQRPEQDDKHEHYIVMINYMPYSS